LRAASVDVPTIFPALHKAQVDNMKSYVEKKRLRLAEKQTEQKDEQLLPADSGKVTE